ncbi:VOC family protein [Nocardia sp. BMG51109]|uniref:VOC family protein n=1 Tax=Nocardia sp. BMG51109 TaxID=1056816 RepID=UPI000463968D|nr:VOC family protein [Nocardia sp. BMG51109]
MSYSFKPGDPCWAEIYTSDPDRTIEFYNGLFGWTAERAEEHGGYITFRKDGNAVAGGMGNDGAEGAPDQWTVYLASPDARVTTDAATAHGGRVIVEPMPVGDLGTMAVLTDCSGAGVGVWQAGVHIGFGALGVASNGQWTGHVGHPSWFELHTPAYADTLKFYGEVFGWHDPFTVSDTPEFRYTTIHSVSPMLGGVMDASELLPAGAPGEWHVCFGADDVDDAVKTVRELGGSVHREPQTTPYGRMASVADPGGVRFSIGGNAPA